MEKKNACVRPTFPSPTALPSTNSTIAAPLPMPPPSYVNSMRTWSADLIDVLHHLLRIVRKPQHRPHDVERPGQRPFGTRSVVADDIDDERVVTKPHLLDGIDDLADLHIHVLEEAGEDFLHARIEPLLVRRARLP